MFFKIFSLLYIKLESVGHYQCGKQRHDALFQKFRNDMMYSNKESSTMNISECLSVNLRTKQKIRKEFDDSNADYEGTITWKPLYDPSEKKRTSEFVEEIHAMKDNNCIKSIRLIDRDMGVSELLIKPVVHEDIKYFS